MSWSSKIILYFMDVKLSYILILETLQLWRMAWNLKELVYIRILSFEIEYRTRHTIKWVLITLEHIKNTQPTQKARSISFLIFSGLCGTFVLGSGASALLSLHVLWEEPPRSAWSTILWEVFIPLPLPSLSSIDALNHICPELGDPLRWLASRKREKAREG